MFLVFGGETKRTALPNVVTSLDTVWALFVRAFPERLTMDAFSCPPQQRGYSQVYILDQAAAVFYQLDDLR